MDVIQWFLKLEKHLQFRRKSFEQGNDQALYTLGLFKPFSGRHCEIETTLNMNNWDVWDRLFSKFRRSTIMLITSFVRLDLLEQSVTFLTSAFSFFLPDTKLEVM